MACIAAALLCGCQPQGPDDAFEEYLLRLGRTLDVPPRAPAAIETPAMPGPRELQRQFPGSAIDTLDFLALSGCALQVTIGKRNSSLGRMAKDSQRLLLELEYLRLAPECIAHQRKRGRTALADTLEQAWQAKRDQLPGRIFDATLGGEEYRRFWRGPGAANDYPAATGSQVITALEGVTSTVRRWLDGDYRADNLEFEILLGEVAAGDGGALLRALASQDAWLAAGDATLEESLTRGPICAENFRAAAVDILPAVIRRFFIGGLQPRAARLDQRRRDLLPPLLALENLLETAMPPAYRQWRSERDSLLASATGAPRRHVELLQAVQSPCV